MLSEQIDQDLKIAQKEKNEVAISALRNLKAALKNAEIEKKSRLPAPEAAGNGGQAALTEDEALKVVAKKVKQHKDSIASFVTRPDLVATEIAQMQVLEKYLPEQMSEEDLRATVRDVIALYHANLSDFGKIMKEVVAKIQGRADGSVVSKIVKEELASK